MKLTCINNEVSKIGLCCLDTGAQLSCVSMSYLTNLFGPVVIKKNPHQIKLIGADGQRLDCIGLINLQIVIRDTYADQDFYCLKQGNSLLIGLPLIKRFQLNIHPYMKFCTIGNINEISQLHEDKEM